ncbi:MAG: hypothetical protein WB810_13675 [Candidatus Cybelea sp.]
MSYSRYTSSDGHLRDFMADSDGRWDLGSLLALLAGTSLTTATSPQCGDTLRQRVHAYKRALEAP